MTLTVDSVALRNIGFNTQEERGVDSYHVQTEVSVRDEIVVRTLIARKGHVLDVRSTSVERDGPQDVDRVRRIAERQHCDVVSEVKRGRFDGV